MLWLRIRWYCREFTMVLVFLGMICNEKQTCCVVCSCTVGIIELSSLFTSIFTSSSNHILWHCYTSMSECSPKGKKGKKTKGPSRSFVPHTWCHLHATGSFLWSTAMQRWKLCPTASQSCANGLNLIIWVGFGVSDEGKTGWHKNGKNLEDWVLCFLLNSFQFTVWICFQVKSHMLRIITKVIFVRANIFPYKPTNGVACLLAEQIADYLQIYEVDKQCTRNKNSLCVRQYLGQHHK